MSLLWGYVCVCLVQNTLWSSVPRPEPEGPQTNTVYDPHSLAPALHCSQTYYGCCPDERSPARGPLGQGCTQSPPLAPAQPSCTSSRYSAPARAPHYGLDVREIGRAHV